VEDIRWQLLKRQKPAEVGRLSRISYGIQGYFFDSVVDDVELGFESDVLVAGLDSVEAPFLLAPAGEAFPPGALRA
jgi:hypothetical protein